jgi:hypothetical protein
MVPAERPSMLLEFWSEPLHNTSHESPVTGHAASGMADGTSCRHQIHDGAGREAIHVARVLERALAR